MKARVNVLIAFSMVIVFFILLFHFYGYEKTWRLWNIPTMMPHFADIRVITAGGESYENGYDPSINNPYDPWQRKLNYPKIWKIIYSIGINQSHTTCLGMFLIFLFFFGVFLISPHTKFVTVFFLLAAVLSPATLLGIERGNIDLLIFFLLALSVVAVKKWHNISTMIVFLGFLLKLFPLVGLLVLLRKNQAIFIKSVLFAFFVCFFYLYCNYDDIILVIEATPRRTGFSYGLNVLWMKVMDISPLIALFVRFLSYFSVLLALFFAFTSLFHSNCFIENKSIYLDSFRVGSAIYLATFLLGNNYDYRLMFLIFTIPQLLLWTKINLRYVPQISVITLFGIYLSLWYLIIVKITYYFPYSLYFGYILDDISNWVIFYGLLYLLFFSMPKWVKLYVKIP